MPRCAAALVLVVGLGSGLAAQTAPPLHRSHLEGKWQAKTEDEIRNIMVRSDSSAQFGDQVARWRVVGDSLWLTLGDGVWQVYGMRLEGDRLTLSGGDLDKPVTLRRGGAGAPRPGSGVVPPPPPPPQRRPGRRARAPPPRSPAPPPLAGSLTP